MSLWYDWEHFVTFFYISYFPLPLTHCHTPLFTVTHCWRDTKKRFVSLTILGVSCRWFGLFGLIAEDELRSGPACLKNRGWSVSRQLSSAVASVTHTDWQTGCACLLATPCVLLSVLVRQRLGKISSESTVWELNWCSQRNVYWVQWHHFKRVKLKEGRQLNPSVNHNFNKLNCETSLIGHYSTITYLHLKIKILCSYDFINLSSLFQRLVICSGVCFPYLIYVTVISLYRSDLNTANELTRDVTAFLLLNMIVSYTILCLWETCAWENVIHSNFVASWMYRSYKLLSSCWHSLCANTDINWIKTQEKRMMFEKESASAVWHYLSCREDDVKREAVKRVWLISLKGKGPLFFLLQYIR